jgi:hypothetical protein
MLLVWHAKLDACFFHFGGIERTLFHFRHRRHPPRRPPGGCPAPAPSPLPAITCYAQARCQRAPAPGCSCGGDDLENREKIEVVVSPSPCYCFAGRARPLRGRAAGLVAESGGWRRRPALPHDSHTTHVMKSNSSTHTRNRTRPSCDRALCSICTRVVSPLARFSARGREPCHDAAMQRRSSFGAKNANTNGSPRCAVSKRGKVKGPSDHLRPTVSI